MTNSIYATFAKHTKTKQVVFIFHVKGEEEKKTSFLNDLVRQDVIVSIDGENELTCELTKVVKDSSKTVIELIAKGSSAKTFDFYDATGSSVDLFIKPSQMSLDEFNEKDKGKSYDVGSDGVVGNVEKDENQADLFRSEDGDLHIPDMGGEENE